MSAVALISNAGFIVFVFIRMRRKDKGSPGTAVANLATFFPNLFVFRVLVIPVLFIKNDSLYSTSANTSDRFAKGVGKCSDKNGIFQSRANVLPCTTR